MTVDNVRDVFSRRGVFFCSPISCPAFSVNPSPSVASCVITGCVVCSSSCGTPISELRSVTCYMGLHSITCHHICALPSAQLNRLILSSYLDEEALLEKSPEKGGGRKKGEHKKGRSKFAHGLKDDRRPCFFVKVTPRRRV